MVKSRVTTHQLREAERERRLVEQQADADAAKRAAHHPWRETLGRPLTHAIRYSLNVALARDVAWIEACRDGVGEALLAELRGRWPELRAADWASLRESCPHVWRLLASWRQLHRPSPRPDRTPYADALTLMARFAGQDRVPCA